MAELAAGLVGAAATVGAAQLATGSGFTGRHESSHREERMETRRSIVDFEANRRSGDVTPDTESEFLETKDEAIERARKYHESIESYKEASWYNPLYKFKKKNDVRKWKRLTRQSNHSLRTLNESMSSGSDTSSITATSGSPPGSNLANDDIQDWTRDVYGAGAVDIADARDSDSMRRDSFNALVRSDGSSPSPNGYHSEGHYVRDSAKTGLASMEDDEVCVEDDETDSDDCADSYILYDGYISSSMKHKIPHIIKMLKDSDRRIRVSAAGIFLKLADHPVFHDAMTPGIPSIVEILKDSDRDVRKSATGAFGMLANHSVFHDATMHGIPHIIDMLKDSNRDVRKSATGVFGMLANHSAFHDAMKPGIPHIIEMLKDGDYWVSAFHDAMKSGIPHIIEMLKDSDCWVHNYVASALGKLANQPTFHDAMKPGIPHIIEMLKDSDHWVRDSAASVFGMLANQVTIPSVYFYNLTIVLAAFHDAMKPGGDYWVRISATGAFGMLANHSVFHDATMHGIPHIIDMLKDSNRDVRKSATAAFHDAMKPGIPQIIEMLKDVDDQMRDTAAGTFVKLADHPVFHDVMNAEIPHIIEMLTDSDHRIRDSAGGTFVKLANHRR
ncbi:armadillo-type protein [Mycena pura]|uniref:Armadillo-type protein n=1 Tax=Mycena pura TaxID=153505 RepID=A0AAD6VSI7_9AGAR|nr:armadillo-type protein [Mycena pura]